MTLKSRGKLLLITITPLLLITLLITGIFYWNGLNALKAQAQNYRNELITTHENSLKANLRMGRTAIKALYESDVNGSNKEKAKAILKDMRFADDGYFFAYNSQGVNTLHAIKPQLEGKNLLSLKDSNGVSVIAGLIKASTKGDGFLYFSWHKPSIDAQAPKLGYAEYLPKWDWVLGTGVYIDDVDSQVTAYVKKRKTQISSDTTYAIILSMIGLVVTTFIIGIIVTKALKPLRSMVENLHDIAQGGGDLTNRLQTKGKDEIAELGSAFNLFMDKLQPLIKDIQDSSVSVRKAAQDLDHQTGLSVKTMHKHSQETEQVVTAVTEMAATSREVANNTNSTSDAIESANNQINNAQKEVNLAIQSINDLVEDVNSASHAILTLSDQTNRITSVIDVIGSIAEQTNLLALNAAIEAARAGEQGRGFAVVADEVRSLASRTQASTKEINDMLSSLQNGVSKAVTTMTTSQKRGEQTIQESSVIKDHLSDIHLAVVTIQDMGIQTASAAEEQSSVAEGINKNLSSIQDIVHQLYADLKVSEKVSSSLSSSGSQVNELVGHFKV